MKKITVKRPLEVEEPRKKINPKAMLKTYLSTVEDELKDEGVTLLDIDNYLSINDGYLKLPTNVTNVSSKALGEYLNAYTQQKCYLRTLESRTELLLEDYKREYNLASRDIYIEYTKDKLSETAKERMVTSDPRLSDVYENYVKYSKKLSVVKNAIENIEDIIFMISREVTRRTGDFNEDTRNHNVSRQ